MESSKTPNEGNTPNGQPPSNNQAQNDQAPPEGKIFNADGEYRDQPNDVLVTGSSGHLGNALMMMLPRLGYNPLGIDILPSPWTHRVGDISNRSFVQSVLCQGTSIQHVLHAATLHKPHVGTHSMQEFIDTNITGTLNLLEVAASLKTSNNNGDGDETGGHIKSFIFFSTTSTFGAALSPRPGSPAAWIDESVVPVPKNIYGVTKVAAEDMCQLVHKATGMPTLILRTSRFFLEEDDDAERRAAMSAENLKLLELAYRRTDMEDIVTASTCAMRRAGDVKFGRYIISALPPFPRDPEVLTALDRNPGEVLDRFSPECAALLSEKGWKHLARIDRVYDPSKAIRELGWDPKFTFARAVKATASGEDWRSELSRRVGMKGYHATSTGVYTVR